MTKSDYTYSFNGNILIITDSNLGRMSLTNDIENVIDEISKKENIPMKNLVNDYRMIQVDSEHEYSHVFLVNGMPKWNVLEAQNLMDAIEEMTIGTF